MVGATVGADHGKKEEKAMAFLPSLGKNPVLLNVFRKYPDPARPLLQFHQVVMCGEDSPFTQGEREMIAAYVSRRNGCTYCAGVHTATAEALGIETGLVAALADDIESAKVDEKLKPVLRFVAKLTDRPDSVTQADADAVYAAGWDERALVDAVLVCCIFNFMNRLVEGLGIKADEKYFKMAAERLSKDGYKMLLSMLPAA